MGVLEAEEPPIVTRDPGTAVEPVANQILQDPIFGHLSSMWNNIETSQELSLRH